MTALATRSKVDPQGCDPKPKDGQPLPSIDWGQAKSLDFLNPYLIKSVGDVRVAIIGIDNVFTPTTTTLNYAKVAASFRGVEAEKGVGGHASPGQDQLVIACRQSKRAAVFKAEW